MLNFLLVVLLIRGGVCVFKMGNTRMQMKTTHFCNLDLRDIQGNPVACHISKAMETEGLVLPGMDDNKSFTVHRDIFVVKDGQAVVQAAPSHPYLYILMSQNDTHFSTSQLFNRQSFLLEQGTRQKNDTPDGRRLNANLTLEGDGWVHKGLVDEGGQKLHKWVRSGVEGVDPKSGLNFTALAQTGVITNAWVLYLDKDQKQIVKLLGINTFENDKVYLESEVTHWEELDDALTLDVAMKDIHAAYDIVKSHNQAAAREEAPQLDAEFIKTRLVGEEARLFFNDGKSHDWRSNKTHIRGDKSVAPIDYFRLPNGTAAHKFFLYKYHSPLQEKDEEEFQLPPACRNGVTKLVSQYCLYVGYSSNDTLLALDLYMAYTDLAIAENRAHLNVTVHLKQPKTEVLLFAFEAAGCALVWAADIGFAGLRIQVCLTGAGSGGNGTYAGKIAMSVAVIIRVAFVPALKATLSGQVAVNASDNGDVKAYGELGIDVSAVVVGAGISLDIFGNTVDHKSDIWEFKSHFNLHVWVDVFLYSHDWPWSWTIWEAGPVKLR
ncbi:hypothetical protein Pmar_PMAR003704 [Perkinsus marinus ATCC 50983]|uniref:Uncharacterized protein n=1 Tax=Perkinsus marinus (strain ATCC 50983 / TXsc) TaxID=423536 RepID=C5KI29_PERM5|nr:hypothetical protein Pmar_PMAR003704 [Perkinsus marinus ATCC 50983]EER16241.1 hypothetical protein Pmar_PMAR003704 [Perkinsus marinus ATCC 50983]|eukprot:XP_002784445.1 hypothetical protein Pmar_PMAR003704 [Perkinsus marinus ATCC 50983]